MRTRSTFRARARPRRTAGSGVRSPRSRRLPCGGFPVAATRRASGRVPSCRCTRQGSGRAVRPGARPRARSQRAAAEHRWDGRTEPRSGSLGLGVAERRRPARGKRAGQSHVPGGRERRTVADERAQLPDLGLRGGAGADRRLRVRRAHQHRVSADVANDLDMDDLNAVQWSWTLLVAVVHGVIVMLEWCYAIDLLEQLRDGEHHAGAARDADPVHPAVAGAGAGGGVGARPLPRDRAPAGGRDARPGGADGGDDAGRAVGDRQPDGHDRRARCVGQRSEPGHARGGGRGHARASRARSRGRHGEHLQRRDRRTVVLHGVRQRALVQRPWSPGPAAEHGWVSRSQPRNRPRSAARARNCCAARRRTANCSWRCPRTGRRATRSTSPALCSTCCAVGSAEPCLGPTAKEAEFRTGSGTIWRVAGLWLFWFGALGMVLLLGFIALRLLGAAIFSLFFLLLAPGGGDRTGAGRRRPRGVPSLGDAAARGGVREADLLVPARRRAADAADVDELHRVRLGGAVAARLGDVVVAVRQAPSGERLRPRRARGGASTPLVAGVAAARKGRKPA